MSKFSVPVTQQDRIQSLDLLRGIAILGILIMNIQSFSMPGVTYINPTVYGDLEGANWWVWTLSHLFADQKFMSIFSILFGAGIVLVTTKAESKTGKSAGLHYRRTGLLLLIGLAHAHLIWMGDILVAYAICAFLLYPLRKKSTKTLLILAFVFFIVPTLLNLSGAMTMHTWPEEQVSAMSSEWFPSTAIVQQEIAALTGSVGTRIAEISAQALHLETTVFFFVIFWRVMAMMLLGMALFKMGVLSASRSSAFYKKGAMITLPIGLALSFWGIDQNFSHDWAFEYSMLRGSNFNYWGSIFTAFAFICIVMLVSQYKGLVRWKARLSAVGQMALTNYIGTSIICTFFFYGLGYFGQVSRLGQMGVTLLVWLLIIGWSSPWLRRHHFGPLEWLWRSATYGRWQKWKRGTD